MNEELARKFLTQRYLDLETELTGIRSSIQTLQLKLMETEDEMENIQMILNSKQEPPTFKCGLCGEEGHKRNNCPRKKAPKKRTYSCSNCGKPGHTVKTCPDAKPAPKQGAEAPDDAEREAKEVAEIEERDRKLAEIEKNGPIPKSKLFREKEYADVRSFIKNQRSRPIDMEAIGMELDIGLLTIREICKALKENEPGFEIHGKNNIVFNPRLAL